ncbi:uncharacterized protein N7473_011154 [Penicillium subrubescens]|uniref:uncharacterized protein n=1 Tax=Penicillium subrubescens TaxID=1316194 RepID=UPI002545A681|nr:uncharacterized protein N7473_011154 [Penicillium subrubescens]KAJ5882720.1 hypothetical protein N7473_011154 [Penicillium subrubescens]
MPVKRGAPRRSCDLCHQQKRKCDRSSRIDQGGAGCSRCITQKRECHSEAFEQTDVPKRQRVMARSPSRESSVWENGINPVGSTSQDSLLDLPPSSSRSTSIVEPHELSRLRSDPTHFSSPSTMEPPRLSFSGAAFLRSIFVVDEQAASFRSPSVTSTFPDSQISHSPDSSTLPSLQSAPVSPKLPQPDIASNDFRLAHSHVLQFLVDRLVHSREKFDQDIFVKCHLTVKDLAESLRAYFDIPGIFHPFIPEDAFWEDLRAGICSPTLLAAIASRGIPFTNAKDKWEKQKLLVVMCMDEIMEVGVSRDGSERLRLDDLEAMALMMDLKYKSPHLFLGYKHEWRRLFAYDSLVKETLKGPNREPMASDPSGLLARADERYMLLYFHVYTLDSFQCLSRKTTSVIPDDELSMIEDTSCRGGGGYLDAMLGLAIIARRILRTLCNPAAPEAGIDYRDVICLYELLHEWRKRTFPSERRTPKDRADELTLEERSYWKSTPVSTSRQIDLYHTILWALEIDCYMQIDDCVSRYGWQDNGSIRTEAVTHRIEYESLQAMFEAVDLAELIRRPWPADQDAGRRPLVDLAPSILRNICADVCDWVCLRGKRHWELLDSQTVENANLSQANSGQLSEQETQRLRVLHYAGIAKLLRDTVAAASAHRDTKKMVQDLDYHLIRLQEN